MVEISVNIDENSKVTAFFVDNISGAIKLDVDEALINDRLVNGTPYKYLDGSLSVDTDKQSQDEVNKQIADLKVKLSDTDYVAIKVAEYSYTGETIPDNYPAILQQRQQWRDQINQLGG